MHPGIIPFALLLIPILEIAVFILVGGEIGVIVTLGLILLTAIIGSILLRIQGISILQQIRLKMEADEVPGRELIDGVMVMAAGILLLTPGFVTDFVGFLLFLPPLRAFIWRTMAPTIIIRGQKGRAGRPPGGDNVVDLDPSEFSEKPQPNSPWYDQKNSN